MNATFAYKICFMNIIEHMGYEPVKRSDDDDTSNRGRWELGDKVVELHDDHFIRKNGECVTYEDRVNQFNSRAK